MHAWVFCAGWMPERWALYGALHEVADWAMLIELMAELRSLINHPPEPSS